MNTYVWIDGTWTRGQDGKPRVILYGRDYENVHQTVYKAVRGFKPYFYAPSHEVEEPSEVLIDALGRRVKKVFANLPSDVRRLREQYSWTDEADVLFDVRFVVDAGIKYAFDDNVKPVEVDKPLQPRVCFFDIEVDSPPEIMPRPEKPEWPIVMIQCLDSYTGEIRIFTWNMPERVDEQVICSSEKHMLYEFARYVQRKDFDVLSGWFCVPKGTYIETANGLRKIEQIGERDRLIEQVSVRRKYETGIKPIVRVYTKLGWWFDASTQHKFKAYKIPEGVRYNRRNVHTYDWDWVPAEKLNDSHILECPFAIYVDNQPTPELTEKLCYLAGFAYGDGSIQDYTAAGVAFKIYQKDGNLLQQITGRDKVWQHPDGTYMARVNLQQASDLIVQNGRKQLNYEKLSQLSLRQFAAFVAGWFDADGYVQRGGGKERGQGYTIAITDKNWKPIASVLFKDFGVVTRVSRDSYNVVWYIRLIAAIPEFWEVFCEWSRKVTKDMVRNKVARTVSPNRLEHFSWTVIGRRLYVRVDHVDQIGAKETMDMETSSHWYSIGCITHNSNGYDLPYLKKRSDKIGVPLQLTRYPSMSGIRLGKRSVRIVGRQCVDLLEAFKKWHKAKGELETYDLKYVSKKFGGFQYEDYGDSIRVLLESQDYETLLEYGRNDVIALQRIDEKIGLFEFYEYLRFIVGCKLEDTLQNSKIIEMLLMRAGIKPMPTRQYGITEEDRYTGALVLQPPLGIHEWVGVFDLASLYPSIIMAFDVSPDVDKMIPKVITTVLQEREKLRKLRLVGEADETTKMKEIVLKFIANSFYGVLGWPGFRLYKRELAEFITTKGREINRYLQRCAAERGFKAIYGDSVDPESPVLVLRNGFVEIIPIDEVVVGDLIWTGKKWKTVRRVIVKPKRKQMYRVITRAGIVDVTEDHSLIQDGQPVTPLEATHVDYVPMPDVNSEVDILDEDLAWLIGLYLAEGSRLGESLYVINNQDVRLLERCQQIVERVTGKLMRINNFTDSSRCRRITIPAEMKWWFEECYSEKGRKIVPWYILNAPERILRAFIDGFYAGDGDNSQSTLGRYTDKWKRIDQRSSLIAVGLQYVLERLGYTVSVRPAGSNKMSWGLRIGRYRRKDPREITHVMPIDTKYDYVVDIEVEDDHVFAVGHLLLHNTDSVFIRGVMSPKMGLELQEYFNGRLQEWADEVGAKIAPTIKFEKLFRRIIFKKKIGSDEAAKKRYAGWLVWEDGREVDEIKIVGMETRRSDVAEITRELMEQIMVCLLKEGDTSAVGRILRKVLKEFDRLPLQKIAIPKGVKKDLDQYKTESAWIVGMRNAQKLLGLRFRQDRKPKLLYMKRPVDRLCITEDVEALPEHFQVDWETMKEKVIRQKFEAILESIGLSWDQVVEGQTTLEGWF